MMLEVVRTAQLQTVESDGRTLVLRAVPFDVPTVVSDDGVTTYREVWRRGAFKAAVARPSGTLLRFGHQKGWGDALGHAVLLREDGDALHAEMRVWPGEGGDKLLHAIEAGALSECSIGAVVAADGTREKDGLTERVKVSQLREISIVQQAAYPQAQVLAVRHADPDPYLAKVRAAIMLAGKRP